MAESPSYMLLEESVKAITESQDQLRTEVAGIKETPKRVIDQLSMFSLAEPQSSLDVALCGDQSTLPVDSTLHSGLLDSHQPTSLEFSCLHKHKHMVGRDSFTTALVQQYPSNDFECFDGHPPQLQQTTTTKLPLTKPILLGEVFGLAYVRQYHITSA
ncbi:hypothetical protein Tsubulata_043795 [Turnera subulata]|uniref:Uncharacterized protein n=1 Tax=Turnera subulata TaxID=218843 RepID=A0A9Q0F9T0_9ROSI|nr:hypothetical protein Tsubulata_043795 [Turnera subulata]